MNYSAKNSMLRKIIILLISIALILSTGATLYSYADEQDRYALTDTYNAVDGDRSIEEGDVPYVQTKEDQILLAQKTKAMNALLLKESTQPSSKAYGYKYLNVPLFTQQNNYYCGPANVKQVVHYHNGSSNSQDTYARSLGTSTAGTTMTDIPPLLRSQTGKNYVYAAIGSSSTWTSRVGTNILYNNMAVVIDIIANTSYWRYNTNDGHYVTIHGVYHNGTAASVTDVAICDPHNVYPNRYYYRTVNQAYTANNNH